MVVFTNVWLRQTRSAKRLRRGILNGLFPGLLGSDPESALDIADENFAVPDLAGLGRLDDGFDCRARLAVRQDDLQLDLWKKIHGILAPAVNFGVTFLASKALDLGNSHPLHAEGGEGFFDVLEFERLDDGLNFFHANSNRKGGY